MLKTIILNLNLKIKRKVSDTKSPLKVVKTKVISAWVSDILYELPKLIICLLNLFFEHPIGFSINTLVCCHSLDKDLGKMNYEPRQPRQSNG